MKIQKLNIRLFALSATLIVLDQISKALIVAKVPLFWTTGQDYYGEEFFRIVHIRNRGALFGIFGDLSEVVRVFLLIILPLAFLFFLAHYIIKKSQNETFFQKYCLAGVLGGGMGNIIDRTFRPGGVVDFLDFRTYGLFGFERWPTFNLADTFVVVAVLLLMISSIKLPPKEKNEQKD